MPIFCGETEIASIAIGETPIAGAEVASIANPGSFLSVLSAQEAPFSMPLAYFKMGEPSGTRQSSVGSYSLSAVNSGASSAPGVLGSAALFLNNNGCLTGPALWPAGSTSGTVSVWVYPAEGGRTQQIFGDFFHAPITITINSSGGANAALGLGAETAYSSPLPLNQWSHLVAVWDGAASTITLFINGQQSQQSPASGTPSFGGVTVGAYEGGSANLFAGRIDELGVWDVALTLSDIERLYNSGAGFDPTPPIPVVATLPASSTAFIGAITLAPNVNLLGDEATYQWEKQEGGAGDFVAISGATASTLTLTNLTDADDTGDAYRVIVSVAGRGSVTTNATTITVDDTGDPFFADVIALLPFDGPNESTVYTDLAANPITPTFYPGGGTHAISAENPKFGSGALKVTGNAWPTLNFPTPILWTEAVTVELWFRTTDGGTPLQLGGGGEVQVSGGVVRAVTASGSILFTDTKQVTDGEWHHLAVSRAAGETENDRYYLDGQLIGEQTPYWRSNANWASVYFARPGGASIFVDDFRLTKAERYTGQSFAVPTAPHFAPVVATLPASSTAYGGAITLAPTSNIGSDSATYQWQKQEGGAGEFVAIAGATASTLTLENLTDADDTGDAYRVVVSVVGRGTVTTNATTLTVDESGINADNRFRVTAAASTTALTAAVDSTTGYWKMVSSTGQESAVIGSEWSQMNPYYWNTGAISGMPSGSEKTVEIFSCDASGNPSGELEYVSFAPSTQAITAADASGCTSLRGFNLSSSATPYGSWAGVSTMPAALVSVRAVGVIGSGGMYSQWGPYPANVMEGINVAGQSLSAAALNQLYEDLGNGINSARIFVPGNPGTADDNESIATGKGYTIFGS